MKTLVPSTIVVRLPPDLTAQIARVRALSLKRGRPLSVSAVVRAALRELFAASDADGRILMHNGVRP